MKENVITEENRDRRYGTTCKKCKRDIDPCFFLEGSMDGESMRFCSIECYDDYIQQSN